MHPDTVDVHLENKPDNPILAARRCLKFKRLGGRAFHDLRHSSRQDIDERIIKAACQNIFAARANGEREYFFEKCIQDYMVQVDIFKDYNVLNYETGELVHYDPPAADAKTAHDETAEFIARKMLGAAFESNRREALNYLLGKLYDVDERVTVDSVHPHALMYYCSADIIARAINGGRLKPEDIARYRDVSDEDDIVSRLLREGHNGNAQIRKALGTIDAIATIDWNSALSMWPIGGYSSNWSLRAKAVDKDLLPAA
jgi:hypothetical protein